MVLGEGMCEEADGAEDGTLTIRSKRMMIKLYEVFCTLTSLP